MGVFTTQKSAFRKALEKNDLPAMRSCIGKKGDATPFYYYFTYSSLSKEMLQLLLTEVTPQDWALWRPKGREETAEENRNSILITMTNGVLGQERFDLVETLAGAKIDFNGGPAKNHSIASLVNANIPDAEKAGHLRKMLAGGYDKIENADSFLQMAADKNFVAGIDVLAAAGFDIHAHNEQLLRNAARASQSNLCLHLINTHKADLGLAITTARGLGNAADAAWLETFGHAAGDEKPATIESLTAEVRELKSAFRAMAALVQEMHAPEKRLDKPLLPTPKGLSS